GWRGIEHTRMNRRTTKSTKPSVRARSERSAAARASVAHRFGRTVHANAIPFVLALVFVHVVLSLLALDPTPHTGGDNAGYITLARSLLDRGAYLELWDPAEPIHTKYPPVFPLILAGAMALGVKPWVGLKLIVVAFSALGVAFTFLWIRARGRPALAAGVGGLLALSPGIILQNHWVLSDVPFWGLTMLALWALGTAPRRRLSARFALALIAVVLAYFTRSAGLPVVLAALAWLALRRRWLQLGVMAGVLVPLAAWWILRARSADGVDYTGELWMRNPYNPAEGTIGMLDLLPRIGDNLIAYVTTHVPVLLIGRPGSAGLVLSIVVTLLALAGWARRAARVRRVTVAELMLPLYIGLIMIWPAVWAGDRFMLPVLTLLLFYAGDALLRIVRRFRPQLVFTAGAAAVALLALLQLPTVVLAVRVGRSCQEAYIAGQRHPCLPAQWQAFFAQGERLPELLPDGAVVLNRKPRLVHVMSGGRVYSLTYPFTPDPQRFLEFADSVGARYVLFDELGRLSQAYLVPVLTRRPAAFCLIDSAGESGTALFGINDNALELPDASGISGPINFPVCDATLRR
ncbi:MAG: ArnT family glycosyltransferase, partial [Longimicrobiales bacterium]